METKTDTQTIGTDATVETVTVEKTEEKKTTLHPAIFLLFSEYLGFVSDVIEFAEEWCNNKAKIESWKKSIVEADAIRLFHKMKKHFKIDEIKEQYTMFYDIAIKSWVEKLEKE